MSDESRKTFEKAMRDGFGWKDSDFVIEKGRYRFSTTADAYTGWLSGMHADELAEALKEDQTEIAALKARVEELSQIIDDGIDKLTTKEMSQLWIREMVDEHEAVLLKYEARIKELESSDEH